MIKILITGYNGFVGSAITSVFTEYNLSGVDLFPGHSVHQHVDWKDLEKVAEADTIIHLAGKAQDTRNVSTDEEYFEINLGLTQIIFDHFLRSNSEKFIFFSSVKAVADTAIDDHLSEDDKPNPETLYGKSKLAAEQYILSKAIPAGKQVYILRPCMIHGPGNKKNLKSLYNLIQKRVPWPLGAFENLRSFTSIGNLMFILRELIEKDIEPGVYQVADDDPLSTNELIEMMAISLNRKPYCWRIPKVIILAAAKLGDITHLPLNTESLKKLTDSYVVSNQKLKSALGITHLPLTSREGLMLTLDSFNTGRISNS
jgi:nucleoside-diphosphate-sugar epimerase